MNLNVGLGIGVSAPIPVHVIQADIRKNLVGIDVCCDLGHLPFKNDAFENVYCIHTLEHLTKPVEGLKELIRVCRDVVEIVVPHWLSKQAKAPTHTAKFRCSWFSGCLKNFTYCIRTPWGFPRYIDIHVWIYPHLKKGVKVKNKTIVVDLDNTLFKPTWVSKLCFSFANKIFLFGLKREKLNKNLVKTVSDYDKKIILSGRANDWMKETTIKQLKKYRIDVDEILLCPRGVLYLKWKKEQIRQLRRKFPDLVWVDDAI